jgi:quinol monooxygenase YgiN
MSRIALFVKHRTLPGKRDEVRRIWEKHMAPAVSAHGGHTAYFYCFEDTDPDGICAFQEYVSREASEAFLETDSYAAYIAEVEPLLSGPPVITRLNPVWSKPPI